MQVSDCVDTALTRARQARLPSPWTGRGIWKRAGRASEGQGKAREGSGRL